MLNTILVDSSRPRSQFTAWHATGTAGVTYTLINTIVTSVGEEMERSIDVRVRTAAAIAGITA